MSSASGIGTFANGGLDNFWVGPGLPVFALYGERAYRAALTTPGLYRFTTVGLPDNCSGAALLPLLAKLKSRAVVLWPAKDRRDAALKDAAALVGLGATAVGIVQPPEDWPPNFQLGDPPQDSSAGALAKLDIAALVNATLRDATALALPIHATRQLKQTRAVVPARAPVDGGALFTRLRAFLSRHIAEPQPAVDTIALWCVHAWAHEAFDVSPRLILHANDPRAAHARALRLVAWLTPAPLVVSRTIASHLLPVIAADRPTLLLDDVGGTMLGYVDMRALIAAGALRDGAFLGARTRTNPSGWSPCFAPTAIATTARLPADVEVRAIVVPLAPPANDAAHEALTLANPPAEALRLRADMQRWTNDTGPSLSQPAAHAVPNLDPTTRANWRPLLTLAGRMGTDAANAAATAMQTFGAAARRLSTDVELLDDVRDLVGAIDADARVPSLELLAKLVSDPERAWGTAHRGRKLTPRALADRLDRFGVRPQVLRLPGGTMARGYRGDDLIQAFARYLGDQLALDQLRSDRNP